jgi:hypothetical protein
MAAKLRSVALTSASQVASFRSVEQGEQLASCQLAWWVGRSDRGDRRCAEGRRVDREVDEEPSKNSSSRRC